LVDGCSRQSTRKNVENAPPSPPAPWPPAHTDTTIKKKQAKSRRERKKKEKEKEKGKRGELCESAPPRRWRAVLPGISAA